MRQPQQLLFVAVLTVLVVLDVLAVVVFVAVLTVLVLLGILAGPDKKGPVYTWNLAKC